MKNKILLPIRSLIVAAIVLSTAIYFIKICVDGLSRDYVEEGWIATSATILDPDVPLAGKKNIERVNQGVEQTINYTYSIDGLRHESNSVSKDLFVRPEDYPEGKVVDIFYNPDDVTETVIIRTEVQKHYLYGMMGFCVIVICVTFTSLINDFKNGLK